jgi:hypothetical protein
MRKLFILLTLALAALSPLTAQENGDVKGVIRGSGKDYTVLHLEQDMALWPSPGTLVNLYTRPNGGYDEVANQIEVPDTGSTVTMTDANGVEQTVVQLNVMTVSVTEEEDTIDGFTDRWVEITYEDKSGWVFGAYLSVERGGPKYYLPDLVEEYYREE